jgi:signal transduction histidine kinase
VAWAVGSSAARQSRSDAAVTITREADAGGTEVGRVLDRAGGQAVAIARLPAVQRALASRDRETLVRIARRHPGASFLVRGEEVPAVRLPAPARRTAVVTLGGKPIGTVVVGVGRGALESSLGSVRVRGGDMLFLDERGTVAGGTADVRIGGRTYRAASAPLSARLEVVAGRPLGSISTDVRNIWLLILGAALATLATVGVTAWAIAPIVERSRIAYRERSEALRVLSHVRDGVFLCDEQGTVRFWNRAAELITGLERGQVWGRALAELPGFGDLAGEIPVGEEGSVRPRTFPVQLGLRELWLSLAGVATPEGTVYTFADVTEEQRVEQLKNDFVATVSHELRTPLAGVYGTALTLRDRGEELTSTRRTQLFAALGDQAEQLARVIEDILVASGIDSDRLLLAENRFEAAALAQEVVEEARVTLSTTRVQLVESDQAYVVADAVRTRQVLENLIDNAVKYADRGPVWVAVERGDGVVTFGVSDEGPGIPEEKQERIFEKFYRSDVQMEGGVGGTGLGLYISRELVRRMGGRLWVESTAGGGSLFSFELPSPDA